MRGSELSPIRGVAAAAAAMFPWAKRNRASPGCGSKPRRFASRYASSAAASSPQAMDLPLLVEGLGGGRLVLHLRATLASRCASSSASRHAPCSSMISARCSRHRPVKATMSG